MRYIETILPPSPEVIKEKFLDPNVVFVVDYANSKLKGRVFLTYLTNLELEYRIKIERVEDANELLEAYLNASMMISSVEMEELALNMLLAYNGAPHRLGYDPTPFIEKNGEILERWSSLLASMEVYTLTRIEPIKGDVSVPTVEGCDMTGCNFANLLKYPEYVAIVVQERPDRVKYYRHMFEEYVYAGNNLFHYWNVEENPYSAMAEGMFSEEFNDDDFRNAMENTIKEIEEVLSDVSSV